MLSPLFIFCFLFTTVAENWTNCVHWKKNYDGVKSEVLIADCKTKRGTPICCAAVSARDDLLEPRGVGFEGRSFQAAHTHREHPTRNLNCNLSRVYHASPYEEEHLSLARELHKISSMEKRKLTMLRHLSSAEEIRKNYLWLYLVRQKMRNEKTDPSEDAEILSRFVISETCTEGNGTVGTSFWTEWIEPLTVHGRHPFAFAQCRHIPSVVRAFPRRLSNPVLKRAMKRSERNQDTGQFPDIAAVVPIMNVDYILLQSAESLYGLQRRRADGETESGDDRTLHNKHIMMDAGSSTFDSSLFWSTCSYSQVGISFDRIFAWEKNLLNPAAFWNKVPVKWHPYVSFYNIPIGLSMNHSSKSPSPLQLLKQIAKLDDFVSFKLDIDNVEVELGLANELAVDDSISRLVDEFFFEIHFRCEIMTKCGWKYQEDTPGKEIVLDRLPVLQYFRRLRERGIRSHFWP